MLKPGDVFAGRYEILELIRRGGASLVCLVRDRELDRTVALKLLTHFASFQPIALERFRREARAMAGLSHPNVVTVYNSGSHDGLPYLVMEFIEGRNFGDVIGDATVPREQKLRMLADASRGVQAVHDKGIIHRDLKPSNILVSEDGTVRVTDFGIVRIDDSEADLTRTEVALGTPLYMAPEQVRGAREVTARSDVYGLGSVLFQILCGRPPRESGTQYEVLNQILEQEPPRPRRLVPGLPADLEAICLTAMEREPAHRYSSAGEFGEDLSRCLRGDPISARPPVWTRKLVRALLRRRALVSFLLLAFIGAGALAFFGVSSWRQGSQAREKSRMRTLAMDRAQRHLAEGRKIMTQLDRLLTTGDHSRISALSESARAEFFRALEEVDDLAEAYLEIARTYREQNDENEAVEFCTRAIEADPRFSAAYLERALISLETYAAMRMDSRGWLNDPTPESEFIRKQLNSDLARVREWSANQAEWMLVDGIGKFLEKDGETAADLLQEYADATVSDPRGWFWAGFAWMRVPGREKEALHAVEQSLRYRPRQKLLILQAGNVHRVLGDRKMDSGNRKAAFEEYRKAVAWYDRALAVDPNYASALGNRGGTRTRLGEKEEALVDLNRAIELAPEDMLIYVNRATLRSEMGDPAGAVRDCNEAIRISPHSPGAYHNRGNAHAIMGDQARAIEDYTVSLKMRPNVASTHLNRGMAYYKLGRNDEAIHDLDESIRLDARMPMAHTGRGHVQFRLREFGKALQSYSRAIEIDVRHGPAFNGRGKARHALGHHEEARQDFDASLRLEPDNPRYLVDRSVFHEMMKEMDDALKDVDRAIRIRPDYFMAWHQRGRVRYRMGNRKGCIEDIRKTLELAPPSWPLRARAESLLRRVRGGN